MDVQVLRYTVSSKQKSLNRVLPAGECQMKAGGGAHVFISLSLLNAQHASVNIYCVKHYTVHMNGVISQHFVQYGGTFTEVFMLMLASYGY